MKRLSFLLVSWALFAQTPYQKPPKEILDVLNAPVAPLPSVNPAHTHVLLLDRILYPSITEVAAPMLRLAGLRINPNTNGPHLGTDFSGASLLDISTGKTTRLQTPPGARLGSPSWSPDGKQFAITNTTAGAIELYLGALSSPTLRKVPALALNDTLGQEVVWLSGSKELLVRAIPSGRVKPPARPAAPIGPNIQESSGRAGPVRTYQDMLQSPYDETLFDYYCTAQLASVDAATLKATPIGKPGLYPAFNPSPDGKHFLVTTLQKPYSYIHPYREFPKTIEVWDRAGKPLHKVASLPSKTKSPSKASPPDPATYRGAPPNPPPSPGGKPSTTATPKPKSRSATNSSPSKRPSPPPPSKCTKTQHRAMGVQYLAGGVALVTDYERDRRWRTTKRIYLDDPQAEPKVLFSLNVQDRYKDPGQPIFKILPTGGSIIQQDGDWVFLRGQGATPKGDRPFLNRFNLKTGEPQPVFRAGDTGYESVVALLTDDASKFLTRYETPATRPTTSSARQASATTKALTDFPTPPRSSAPSRSKLVTYKRDDGVQLSFTLYLPPDYKPGTRLPTIVWAYPREYNDADTAGQVSGSTKRFTTIRGISHLFLLLARLRHPRRRHHARRRRSRNRQQHLHRADRRQRPGRHRQSRRNGRHRPPTASASAATATAPS